MQEGSKKEKWGKPKLIILTGGKPEERVLAVCKSANPYGVQGPASYQTACLYSGCYACAVGRAAS